VSTATDIARGDYGVYNADTGMVTLLGNVTITRGDNAIRGQYAVVDLNNNVSRMMPTAGKPGSRVEGLFIRQDQSGAAAGRGPNGPAGTSPGPQQP
jgi:lipopolysaccharide export system protein LptA